MRAWTACARTRRRFCYTSPLEQSLVSADIQCDTRVRWDRSPATFAACCAPLRQRFLSPRLFPLNVQFEDGLTQEAAWRPALPASLARCTLAMAAVGTHGLLSSRVVRRTSEIGIRMALGARRAGAGVVHTRDAHHSRRGHDSGSGAVARAAFRCAQAVYGAEKMDAWSLGFAIFALAVAGVAATFIPARRATAHQPHDSSAHGIVRKEMKPLMRRLRAFLLRLSGLFRRTSGEDFAAEIDGHLALHRGRHSCRSRRTKREDRLCCGLAALNAAGASRPPHAAVD